ncbi:DUF4268 domain-containing protein [Pseudoalteromonas sp. Xi13]|uniref:DUF4268 domain-containing protein n=1 Tax=Pseudoalteromonas sp. Xi13 TaxID=2490635 RepID=UPI000F75CB7A|nr:DUF4268 domain-containing protein [Pseudoalteromonas sp. Xi13]AZN33303.1 DUF4268 domain-containing protein [Pseudoalteromonas sp. Xi13]
MFKIDRTSNSITPIKNKSFTELGFTERNHLQEWLANHPNAFGEELLIIQKEFAGFEDTRERLDLLALDKEGNLVIIENKLDDSGRDVVWQAMKYAAYCSTLTTIQIISIFKDYLKSLDGDADDASKVIYEFLDESEESEVILNEGIKQRVILVAANFRKEVTSTVLWFREHGLDITCIEVKPYQLGQELALSVNKIIPLKETEDYLISMREKAESQVKAKQNGNRHTKRISFWKKLMPQLLENNSQSFVNTKIQPKSLIHSKSLATGQKLQLNFSRDHVAVRLLIKFNDFKTQEKAFNQLFLNRKNIETQLGFDLDWVIGKDNRAAVIQVKYECDGYDEAKWDDYCQWLLKKVIAFETAFTPKLYSSK